MMNHLCYPTHSMKSFRPEFVCMADCSAMNLATLNSKSEWTINKFGVFSHNTQKPFSPEYRLEFTS